MVLLHSGLCYTYNEDNVVWHKISLFTGVIKNVTDLPFVWSSSCPGWRQSVWSWYPVVWEPGCPDLWPDQPVRKQLPSSLHTCRSPAAAAAGSLQSLLHPPWWQGPKEVNSSPQTPGPNEGITNLRILFWIFQFCLKKGLKKEWWECH